jgi:hypothetical protein
MRTIASGLIGALLTGTLAGCCCCCNYEHSPVAYSEGNCYECGTCTFWGTGYYIQKYGFFHRPCYDPCNNCGTAWTSVPAPAPAPMTAPPPAVRPYDTNPPAPPIPPVPAPEADDTDSAAPAP